MEVGLIDQVPVALVIGACMQVPAKRGVYSGRGTKATPGSDTAGLGNSSSGSADVSCEGVATGYQCDKGAACSACITWVVMLICNLVRIVSCVSSWRRVRQWC